MAKLATGLQSWANVRQRDNLVYFAASIQHYFDQWRLFVCVSNYQCRPR